MSTSRLAALAVMFVAACGGKARRDDTRPQLLPVPVIAVGACARPDADGVIGPHPKLEHADRDLSGDGQVEQVVVDRNLCTADGNCYWNVYVRGGSDGTACDRYAGTIAGASLEVLAATGGDNMLDVRGWWALTGARALAQDYRFIRGGYQVTDTLLCRREADDRLLCAEDAR
jgi:hypothetical protein